MGVKKVYYGPFNNLKSEELYKRVLDRVKNRDEDKFYYLFPNGKLLTTYRSRILDATGGFLDLNLFTFDDVVKEILENENYIEIDESIKTLLITNIVKDLKLNYFRNISDLPGFIKTISNVIGDIKRSLVIPEKFIELAPDEIIYDEIGFIYSEYQKYLKKEDLVDKEGLYLLAIEKLKSDKDFLLGVEEIIIDQFYDFRPIELEILKEISKKDINIYINIPFKKRKDLEIIINTLYSLENIGFTIEETELEGKTKLEETFFLEENFGEIEKIKTNIITATTKDLEVKKVFQKIKEKIYMGYEYSDILIVPIEEEYRELIQERAIVERIPLSENISSKMIDNNLILEVLGLFLIKIEDDKDSILSRLKNKLFNFNLELEYDIYPYLKKMEFNNLEELVEITETRKVFEMENESLEYLVMFIEEIKQENKDLKINSNIKEYNQYLKNIIKKYNIQKKINNIINYSQDKFYKNTKILIRLNEILDEIEMVSELLGEINIEEYYNLLVSKFKEEEISKINGKSKGIQVLDLIDVRGIDYRAGYILGLSENNYPSIREDNFFINDKNYKSLKNMNIDVKNYKYKLENEIIKFSTLISSLQEEINFSYSKGVENESIASMFLDEIKRIVAKDINFINVSFDYMIKKKVEELTTKEELTSYILKSYYEDKEIDKRYIYYHNSIFENKFKKIQTKIQSDYNRSLKDFDEYSGILTGNQNIIKELEENHKEKVYSSSYLERYTNCPFSFLLGRILKIDEYAEASKEYDPIIIGNIYHSVLKDFYTKYTDEIKQSVIENIIFELEDKKEYLLELVLKHGLEYELDLSTKSKELLTKNIKSKIYSFIEVDMERIQTHKLIPYEFEKDFGYKNKVAIYEEGKELLLNGKLDRIDKTLDEKSIVMDYKSGSPDNSNLKSMMDGISLQMPIYLLSQKENNPVAALYGVINQSEFRVVVGVLGETSIINNRHSGKLESVEDLNKLNKNTEKVIFNIERKILKGKFPVDPNNCPDYCPYKEICRYKEQVKI